MDVSKEIGIFYEQTKPGMKALPNDIVLRPRFQLELPQPKESVLESFENKKKEPFLINRIDDHVFIKFQKKDVHFWSPQLHLEINEIDTEKSKVYGLFGPNPTLWTFFMFLHFCDSKFENEHHKDTKLQIFVVEANTKNYKGTVVAKDTQTELL